jgi:hypothetical protein
MNRTLLLLILSAMTSLSIAQAGSDSLLRRAGQNVWVEKLFVSMDRPNYLAGETMNLRLFYVDGFKHEAANLSKVAYVELINARKESVLQVKLKLVAGAGTGQLFLPDNLATGLYQLRAYTRWMRNESERFFFTCTVPILNPMEPAPLPSAASVPIFRAEGGHLVAGVVNRVAFYVPQLAAAPFSGVVQNQREEVVAEFASFAHGRGDFAFTPEVDQVYTAVYSTNRTQTYRTALPPVDAAGFQTRVARVAGDLQIRISAAPVTSALLTVLLHQTRMATQPLVVQLENGQGAVRYPWSALPSGITQITVFDSQGRPVAERSVFKAPAATPRIEVKTTDSVYSQRKAVTVSIGSEFTVSASLSVAVYRLDSLPAMHTAVQSNLWLESDLGEAIENAAAFMQPSDSSQRLADLLMLTTGPNRYSIRDKKSTAFAPELYGPLAEGIVTDEYDRAVAGLSLLASTRGNAQIYTTLSDRSGKFTFELPDLAGEQALFIQNWTDASQPLRSQWISPFDQRVSFAVGGATQPVPEKSLQRAFIHQQVETAFRNSRVRPAAAKDTLSAPFYGTGNESYRLDDYTRFPTLEEVFREYVKGVWVRKNKTGFYFLQINRLNQSLMEGSNLVLLNGQPIRDINRLMEFDPLKVERIDVVDRKFFAGPITFQGIVDVITTSKEAENRVPDEAALQLSYQGYQPVRNPIETDRAQASAPTSRTPDFRHQLYWNPTLTLTPEGTQFKFMTSDATGIFVIRVEGLSTDGQALQGTARFKVVR